MVHEENAMIADDPERFADAVVRTWSSHDLWQRLSTNGRENVREYFSVEAASRSIDAILEWADLSPLHRFTRPVSQLTSRSN